MVLTWSSFFIGDEYYDPETEQRGEAEIIIAKQRYGPVGTLELLWNGSVSRFENKVHIAYAVVDDDDEQENYGDVKSDANDASKILDDEDNQAGSSPVC